MPWRKLLSKVKTSTAKVQRVYIEKKENIAFSYYSGAEGSYHSNLRFIEEYAPKYRKRFSIGTRGNQYGLLFDGNIIAKGVYLVVVDGVIEIMNKQCIEFIYQGKITLKI